MALVDAIVCVIFLDCMGREEGGQRRIIVNFGGKYEKTGSVPFPAI
jgi:hypothetical protein